MQKHNFSNSDLEPRKLENGGVKGCKMYECNVCYERRTRLADLIDHLREKHDVKKGENVGGKLFRSQL